MRRPSRWRSCVTRSVKFSTSPPIFPIMMMSPIAYWSSARIRKPLVRSLMSPCAASDGGEREGSADRQERDRRKSQDLETEAQRSDVNGERLEPLDDPDDRRDAKGPARRIFPQQERRPSPSRGKAFDEHVCQPIDQSGQKPNQDEQEQFHPGAFGRHRRRREQR